MKPNLKPVFNFVSLDVKEAAIQASKLMTKLGIRHALIGGLAVGAHGFVRSTKDVDFLVSEDAFDHHVGGLVTLRSGLPFALNNVPIDLIGTSEDVYFEDALYSSDKSEGVPIVPIDALIILKLEAGRRRDKMDIERIYEESGYIDWDSVFDVVEEYDKEHATDLSERLDEILGKFK